MKSAISFAAKVFAPVAGMLLSVHAFAANYNADFSTGALNGWQYSIGSVGVVTQSYGTPFNGSAALLRTNGGAVPIDQVFSFLEAQGVHMGSEFDAIRNTPGAVGSAMVSSEYVDSYGGLDVTSQWLSNSDTVGYDRGAFAMVIRQSDGQGFVESLGQSDLSGQNPADASGTPYLFQSQIQTLEHTGSQEDNWEVVVWTWELNLSAVDSGFGLLVYDAGTPTIPAPDVSSTLGLMALSVTGLLAFRRKFGK